MEDFRRDGISRRRAGGVAGLEMHEFLDKFLDNPVWCGCPGGDAGDGVTLNIAWFEL